MRQVSVVFAFEFQIVHGVFFVAQDGILRLLAIPSCFCGARCHLALLLTVSRVQSETSEQACWHKIPSCATRNSARYHLVPHETAQDTILCYRLVGKNARLNRIHERLAQRFIFIHGIGQLLQRLVANSAVVFGLRVATSQSV